MSIIMDSLRLSSGASSALLAPPWRFGVLPRSTGRPDDRLIVVSVYLYDDQVHQLSATEVRWRKCPTPGELAPAQMLAARIITSVVNESDWYVIANAVSHLGLPPKWYDTAPSVSSALSGGLVGVLD